MSSPLKDFGPRTHKLWGGQLSLCSDLWAFLSHFGLSSDDGVQAQTQERRDYRDRRDTGSDSSLCIGFILISGRTAESMQTNDFSKAFIFFGVKSSTLKIEIKGEAGSLITV